MGVVVEACAKINLTLEVYGKRPDGFHELRSIVLPIFLSDTLEFTSTDDGAIVTDTPYGEKDLIVKAAKALRKKETQGVRVHVVKRIPAGGGLGGGSADAAATLRALNSLWRLDLPLDELLRIGAMVGSDVPALILAQQTQAPVLMQGRGEKVTPFPSQLPPSLFLVLANPGLSSSTAEVYSRCVPRTSPATEFVNDLQEPAVALYPEIGQTIATMKALGLRDVRMSGSGATVFGFASTEKEAEECAATLQSQGLQSWISPPRLGAAPSADPAIRIGAEASAET